ncbi:alpha/beta hydrolase-fold protein [Ideonella sp. YS5]|uniref:alpha/beta hydrolase-fold protein n=1 Tax=Ideonella sp. YS5 TaxID=3453714 RepID=UPI003EEC88B0
MKKPASLLRLAFFIAALLMPCTQAAAQDLPGTRDSLYSGLLKEERVFQVLLPEKYRPGSEEKYDVLYILDGDSNLKSISAIQQFAQAEAHLPPMIMVAVFNTHRDRDMLPATATAASSGAAHFLSFFKNELIPYVNRSYPSNGNNILFGHSFGGVFAMYALLAEPQLFNAYLAIDPSFWWGDGYMKKFASDKLGAVSQPGKSLFIAGREGEGLQQMGIADMESLLKAKAPKDLNWKVAAYSGETHGSVRLKGIYDGLRYFYEGYSDQAVEFHPMNGIVLKDQPYKIYYVGSSDLVRYTTDGSEPTPASAKMPQEITLTNSAQVSAKVVGRHDRHNRTTVGRFELRNAPRPGAPPHDAKPGGLHYSYFEGQWDALPDFGGLTAVRSGAADKDFALDKLPRQTDFACLFEGFIEIQNAGYYVFALDSDDGSKLFLGDQLLISYDGLHGGGNSKSYLIPLEKGFYPIRMEYFQKAGGALLNLRYVVPTDETEKVVPVPLERLYGKR